MCACVYVRGLEQGWFPSLRFRFDKNWKKKCWEIRESRLQHSQRYKILRALNACVYNKCCKVTMYAQKVPCCTGVPVIISWQRLKETNTMFLCQLFSTYFVFSFSFFVAKVETTRLRALIRALSTNRSDHISTKVVGTFTGGLPNSTLFNKTVAFSHRGSIPFLELIPLPSLSESQK